MAKSGGTVRRGRGSASPPTLPSSSSPSRDSPRRLDQEAAQAAWQWVDAVKTTDTRYAALARKLPSYLQVSGLGQTMAFLYSKASDANSEGLLFDQLGQYLYRALRGTDVGTPKDRHDRMQWVVQLTPDDYRQASREARLVSEWLKRFAEGKFGVVMDND